MKNLKRIIALVAVFALALTTFASAASFTDVAEDSVYYRAVEQLHKIGIIDGYTDGTFKPEQTVTRAEMAKLIAAMQGYADSAAGKATTKFSDVPSTHWASGYIASATGTGIDGLPDGTFAPERNVKYEEAVKMIMATLGYTVIANAEGGYPMGYISAAIKEKVTEDVTKANIGSDASRGTIAQLIYNAIDTPLVEQITWNKDGSGDYVKYDGALTGYTAMGDATYREYKTLMTENLEIVKGEGVVTDCAYYGFSGTASIDKDDEMTVDIAVSKVWGHDYDFESDGILVANSDAVDYIGKSVEFYAIQNDYEDWEILSVLELEAFNKSVTFDLDAVDTAKTTDDTAIWYFKDGAKSSTKVVLQQAVGDAPEFKAMFNYTSASSVYDLLAGLKKGKVSGQVTLIDNDKFNGYDAVIIEAAASAVVDEIVDDVIYFKDDAQFKAIDADDNEDAYILSEIDTDDDNLVVKFVKDGAEITADEVAVEDVLSIVYVDDSGYIVADVMSNVIETVLSASKDSLTSVTGKAYKLDGTYYDAGVDNFSIKVGDKAKFYIDKYGKIAYVDDKVSVAGNYAYITGVDFEDEGFGKVLSIQMLTKDGVKVYEAAAKFIVDDKDVAVKDITKVSTDIDYVYDDADNSKDYTVALDELVDTLVDIRFSGATVKEIVTAGHDSEGLSAGTALSGTFVADDFEINSKSMAEDTMVFFVEKDGGVIKKAESYVGTLADLEDGDVVSGYRYTSDDEVDADANIIVLNNAATGISSASALAVVVDFEKTTNEDEEDILVLTVLYNGEKVTLTTTPDAVKSVAVGDVLKIKVNANNVVTAMAVAATGIGDRTNGATVSATTTGYRAGTDETIVAGYATAINKGSKKITVQVGVDEHDAPVYETYSLNKFDKIYVIDNTGRKVEIGLGSASSFRFDERLFAALDPDSQTKDIYVDDASIGKVSTKANNVADYVVIRKYDGDNEAMELVIVKGASYKIK